MNAKALTLSQALVEHLEASGETLEHINQVVFLNPDLDAPYIGGLNALHTIRNGYNDTLLYSRRADGAMNELAKYLMSHRARLGLPVYIIPPAPPMQRAAAEPVRTRRHTRKPRPPRTGKDL
ncbi:MAG: hypothetical protein SFW65_00545 [Alphaproteobacteria bacterium]|nr:hypothetical protein [Alphaproteobacteria bacterium]